ncbi:hypothetical protein FRC03_012704 [Tulasnella sp. 419]|nr:hypothetical protein FRC03_012704 [Tulasnella sp. 419]
MACALSGYCLRGESCWFRHVTDDGKEVGKSKQKEEPTVTETQRDDNKESEHEPEMCGICFDVPTVYGLLDGCSHIFCLSCIKMWRGGGQDSIPQQSQNHRQCPGCRQPTLRFITPSSQFYAEGTPKKIEVKKAYKLSMSKVPCKFFQESSPTNRLCPYGKDCYYLHENPDGTKYQFKHGAKASRRLWNQHQRRLNGQTSEPRFQRRPSWLGGPRGGPSLDLWEYLFEDFDTHGMYDWSDDDDLDDDDDLYDVVDWGVRPARSSIRDEQLNESLTNLVTIRLVSLRAILTDPLRSSIFFNKG